ncbi:hypothetical protein HDF08_003538 [Edaphobacter lichenicola]|uniref:Uncharacterized protein n=1 Tax=Tunturiibacter lichenicola TaxID=2051959 RepID=A0A852VPB6_9BACT|nr:hypothetical protein [Edaphobacter lichenicola]
MVSSSSVVCLRRVLVMFRSFLMRLMSHSGLFSGHVTPAEEHTLRLITRST